MTTQSHNPDDDLSYYETELPKVIAGVRCGEKWEYCPNDSEMWRERHDKSVDELIHILSRGYRVRLAPVPVVKPLNPEDILEMKRLAECLTQILKRYE